MNKINSQDIKKFVEFLTVPRTIEEIKQIFGKHLKGYFLRTKKDYQIIRTAERKIYFIKRDSLKREFEISDVLNEKGNLTNGRIITFPNKWKKIRIVPLGDINYGADNFDKNKLDKYIQWISRDEYVFYFINGNCFSVVNDPHRYNKVFEDFRKNVFDVLKNKLLFTVNGPNEIKLEKSKKIGINPLKVLSEAEQIPFFETQANILLNFKNTDKYFKLFSIHGKSNAIKVGMKINAAINLMSFVDADIIVMSNLKYTTIKRTEIFILHPEKMDIEQRKIYVIILPSFLKYEDGEDSLKGIPPYYGGQVNIELKINGDYHAYSGELKREEEVLR